MRNKIFRGFNMYGRPELFRWTGEKRRPKKGEHYISGAIPEVYRAPNDFDTVFHIAERFKLGEDERLIDGVVYVSKKETL